MDDEKNSQSLVGDVADNLGAVFRHMLPGVLILGTAYVARPSWFEGAAVNSWQQLVLASVVAVAVGNAWFAVNRYGVYQLVDWACYLAGRQGPVRSKKSASYLDDLAVYVREALMDSSLPSRARRHVTFRVSAALLLYTVGELAIFAALWSESKSLLAGHSLRLVSFGIVVLVLGIWQNVIVRRIDAAVLHTGKVV